MLIHLNLRDGVVRSVDIALNRPVHATRIFTGKPVEDVIELLPTLYSICGTAQACAATQACESAFSLQTDNHQQLAHRMLLLLETAKEHLWRIFLDWPELIGGQPQHEPLQQAAGLQKHLLPALFAEGKAFQIGGAPLSPDRDQLEYVINKLRRLLEAHVFGEQPMQWLARTDEAAVEAWAAEQQTVAACIFKFVLDNGWSDVGRCSVPALAVLSDGDLHECFIAPDIEGFITQPSWLGRPRETSSYTRWQNHPLLMQSIQQHGNGLLTRLSACLLELADISSTIGDAADSIGRSGPYGQKLPLTGQRWGISQVEAARGRLIHYVELDGSRVQRYLILAPTEWNFHPKGVLAQGLLGLSADDPVALQAQASLLIKIIDPCVPYELYLH